MRISDWSSDVCSSDLVRGDPVAGQASLRAAVRTIPRAPAEACPGIGFRVGHSGCLLLDVMACENMPARTRRCPGLIHCARCIVPALLFVAKRPRNAALHMFAIGPSPEGGREGQAVG